MGKRPKRMRIVLRSCVLGSLFGLIFPVVSILLSIGVASAQTQQPSLSQAQPAGQVNYDPTRPETQPNLSLDHDPVLSPDAASNAPWRHEATKGTEIGKSKSGIYTLQENVNEVLLNCTVVDDKGQLAMDLKPGDFRVWEDGVAQTVASFQHQDMPVSMGILVDNSGSMRDKRASVDAAALDLVRASNPEDTAFVVNFSDRAYLDQGFTSNISLLERGLSRFDSKGTTAIYDAVAASASELAKYGKQPKQVLLIITDGADNASRLTLQQAIRRVQNLAGPVVYSIGLLYGDDPDEARQAREALEDLSNQTGGLAFFPPSLADVGQIAQEVARDIRNQYTIGYHSTRSPLLGGYRTVRVEARAPGYKKLIVRTKKGYYPRPEQPVRTAEAKPHSSS